MRNEQLGHPCLAIPKDVGEAQAPVEISTSAGWAQNATNTSAHIRVSEKRVRKFTTVLTTAITVDCLEV